MNKTSYIIMMAVDLHRGGELLLSSDQFQLADINDNGVSFSENLCVDSQKPWLHCFDEIPCNGISSPVSSSPESDTDQKDDYCIAELTCDQLTHYMFDPDDEKRCRFSAINSLEKQNEVCNNMYAYLTYCYLSLRTCFKGFLVGVLVKGFQRFGVANEEGLVAVWFQLWKP